MNLRSMKRYISIGFMVMAVLMLHRDGQGNVYLTMLKVPGTVCFFAFCTAIANQCTRVVFDDGS
ncbi:Uncharacterised protein [Moellerella wisconsensis]|nr:Uncharacterised protein [Moellerella wisconsensis]